ncbi:hypothetical protein TRFO_40552 [Tritrichomonas foetus]|uniref:Uncharacterized protein n=1 Tax=Tritrichomonas foetus TaxID=1144522 RepID=A0A1J4J6R3_9EUKA|nr:hypothetical protein TRFO_40552 [Tritrichomonas foetus]|eukprot:OHS93125.1 hypothetical protein TRFO_40552 [Tritrichomonas foetus]
MIVEIAKLILQNQQKLFFKINKNHSSKSTKIILQDQQKSFFKINKNHSFKINKDHSSKSIKIILQNQQKSFFKECHKTKSNVKAINRRVCH